MWVHCAGGSETIYPQPMTRFFSTFHSHILANDLAAETDFRARAVCAPFTFLASENTLP